MDQDLKSYLDEMKRELREDVKSDIRELREEMKSDIRELREEMKSDLRELREHTDRGLLELRVHVDDNFARLTRRIEEVAHEAREYTNERFEQVETKLLTAFHGWARSMEIRVRSIATASVAIDERLAFIEERVSELERRKAS